MDKQQRLIKIKYDLTHWGYGIPIEDIRKDLDVLEKMGATRIDIELENSFGDCSLNIEATQERLETDEERDARVLMERFNEQQEKDRLREDYQRLKQIFEP